MIDSRGEKSIKTAPTFVITIFLPPQKNMRLFRKRHKKKNKRREKAHDEVQEEVREEVHEETILTFGVVDMATTAAIQAGATFSAHDRIRELSDRINQYEAGQIDEIKEVECLPVDVFLKNFRESGSECFCTAYKMNHTLHKSMSGQLFTSLPEDVFSLVEAQTSILDDYLISSELLGTEAGDSVILDCLLCILRNLWYKHTSFRNSFLTDLERCIASSNDFLRMIDKVDEILTSMTKRYPHLVWEQKSKTDSDTALVRQEANDLNSLFGSDSVHAAQRAVAFVMQEIEESTIPEQLFTRDWEDRLTHNEVAVSMVRTFEDFLSDINNYLREDFIYHKLVVELVRSTVCFYVRCLLEKADRLRHAKQNAKLLLHRDNPESHQFLSAVRAIRRMTYDIEVLRDYFYSVAKESTSLGRVVANELSALTVVVECMWLAVGQSGADSADSLEEFVVVVHKRTGADPEVTKQLLSDLWLLMAPEEQQAIENAMDVMQMELKLVSARIGEKNAASAWSTAHSGEAGSRLEDMLKAMYVERRVQDEALTCGNILRDVQHFRDITKLPIRTRLGKENSRNFSPSVASKRIHDSLQHRLQPFKDFIRGDKNFERNKNYSGTPL